MKKVETGGIELRSMGGELEDEKELEDCEELEEESERICRMQRYSK